MCLSFSLLIPDKNKYQKEVPADGAEAIAVDEPAEPAGDEEPAEAIPVDV